MCCELTNSERWADKQNTCMCSIVVLYMQNVLTVHPLTMLAARREDGMSSWIGDSFGGCMPIRVANLST